MKNFIILAFIGITNFCFANTSHHSGKVNILKVFTVPLKDGFKCPAYLNNDNFSAVNYADISIKGARKGHKSLIKILETTISSLRSSTTPAENNLYYTHEFGGGLWYYDRNDNKASDNTGSVIVSTDGKRFKRIGSPTLDSFGGVGDGVTDNTIAINKAILATSSANEILIIPEKTYLVSGNVTGVNRVLFPLYSNTHIKGISKKSVIKVADNFTSKGDYRLFGPIKDQITSNITFENFSVDMNGANNLVHGSTGLNIRRAYTIYISNGNNIKLTKLNIMSNPGRNVIVLGNNSNHPTVTNVEITYNTFTNCGGSIAGNELQNDHSVIFSECDSATIAYNTFKNDKPINPSYIQNKVVTALEVHGSNTKVLKNKVINFTHGGNVVALVQNSYNNYWADNTFLNCTKLGLSLWSVAPYKNVNCTIINNVIQLYGLFGSEVGGIFQSTHASNTTSAFENLKILNNRIYSNDLVVRRNVWHGIYICAVSGADIRNNIIKNIKGNGITILSSDKNLQVSNVKILNNDISNTGLNTFGSMVYSIFVDNKSMSQPFNNIQIDSNVIDRPSSSNSLMRKMKLGRDGTVTDLRVGQGNKFLNLKN